MKKNSYFIIIKTGEAELRAMKNCIIRHTYIHPLIEITRGRKTKLDRIGDIRKRLDVVKAIFAGQNICIDLTADKELANDQIDELYDYDSGYAKWNQFLFELKETKAFKSITPTILVNIDDNNARENLKQQVSTLYDNFNSILYRNNIVDDGCYEDLRIIKDIINNTNKEFIFVLDCEYVPFGAAQSFIEKIEERIGKIKNIIPNARFVIVATSFPRFVSDVGNDDKDTLPITEIRLHHEIDRLFPSYNIVYGDYGSINPIRNDRVQMTRGWVPRIDVPLSDEIFYYRKRRENEEYSEVYSKIAKDFILADERFPINLEGNWGVEQIKACAFGYSPGSSPSFWISVRMNIHIEQQLRRLGT